MSEPPAHDDRPALELRVVIPVLIGLVSLVIAVLTWRAAQLDENATDNDRESISETVLVAQDRASTETQLRDDQQAFVQYKISVEDAALLTDEATQLRAAGLTAQAQVLEDEANAQRETAENLASRTFDVRFVSTAAGALTFDVDGRRQELQALNRDSQKLNPDLAAAKAVELRRSSQWKVAWVVGLVGVILVLTLAQISRRNSLRYALASLSVVLFVGFAVAGFAR